MSAGLPRRSVLLRTTQNLDLHLIRISHNGEGETTPGPLLLTLLIMTPQVTARQNGLLARVECNSSELLPIHHQRLFGQDIV